VIVTVTVLKTLSRGEYSGRDMKDATIAATGPAIRPANISSPQWLVWDKYRPPAFSNKPTFERS
jgi:hypothetical protein